jgi:hypothetical protein
VDRVTLCYDFPDLISKDRERKEEEGTGLVCGVDGGARARGESWRTKFRRGWPNVFLSKDH